MSECNRHAWLEDDQGFDNPCICGLPEGHSGLHECFEGCAGQWAGGVSAEDFKKWWIA